MDSRQSYQWRKQLLWGCILIGIGGALLADQFGYLNVVELWRYWPLLLVVVGIIKMIGYPTARDFISGLWTVIIGVWLFGNFEHLFGMHFENSWPYLIIAWGVMLILKPLLRQRFAANEAGDPTARTEKLP